MSGAKKLLSRRIALIPNASYHNEVVKENPFGFSYRTQHNFCTSIQCSLHLAQALVPVPYIPSLVILVGKVPGNVANILELHVSTLPVPSESCPCSSGQRWSYALSPTLNIVTAPLVIWLICFVPQECY